MMRRPRCAVRDCPYPAWATIKEEVTETRTRWVWRLVSERCERHAKQRAPPTAVSVEEFDPATLV